MRACTALLIVVVAGLTACGGSTTTKTVTETKTVTVTAPGAAQATPEGDPSAAPLPSGVVAVDGTYAMRTRKADYEGENTSVDDEFPTETEWVFKTQCQGDACSLAMRRELGSGAFKNVTLQADPDREGVYVADTTGTTGCATGSNKPPTKQHYSVRITAQDDVDGRPTAKRLDVYFTESTKGCKLSKGATARGIVSWRGSLLP